MIQELPSWLNLLFLLTVAITILLFYYANGKRKKLLIGLLSWSLLQSLLALSGFYQVTNTLPPRFALVLLPATIMLVVGLLPKFRKGILKDCNSLVSTFLHTVRIPVEIILYQLFMYQMVPELMTFQGRNFDIVAGLTAPIIGTFIWVKRASNALLISWNVIGLGLVTWILVNGILSAESPFQQFGFEQPNKAINYFPFILLPAVIVPLVIYTHITDLIILFHQRRQTLNSR